MKTAKLSICTLLLLVMSTTIGAQSTAVTNSLQGNDIATFCSYFDDEVRITISQSEGDFSKNTAQNEITNFFAADNLVSFAVIHQGEKNGDEYIIGELKTEKNEYRMHILVRDANGTPKIQQIRIN